eukprot:TRINITY_DN22819_c0_g1_i3.p1 TRINITY_DN22819_c0_g1~~TRINITY_DN22819_c0_g1_i3.p1  ORF type:complete len:380 (-),score=75.02 TRINITY_DN22819_c0_g1_i3:18-1157(-)
MGRQWLYRSRCPAIPQMEQSKPEEEHHDEDLSGAPGQVAASPAVSLDQNNTSSPSTGYQRAAKRFAKQRAVFDQSSDKIQLAQELFEEAQQAFEKCDALELCRLLLTAASWLSAPLCRSHIPNLRTDTKDVRCTSEADGNVQAMVRRAVCVCLRGLDLTDCGTRQRNDIQLALQHVSQRLAQAQKFEQTTLPKGWIALQRCLPNAEGEVASDTPVSSTPAVGEQFPELRQLKECSNSAVPGALRRPWTQKEWKDLKEAVQDEIAGSFSSRRNRSSLQIPFSAWRRIATKLNSGRTVESMRRFYSSMVNPAYQAPTKENFKPHRQGLLSDMSKHALAKLGGQATVQDVIDFCKQDAEVQRVYAVVTSRHNSASAVLFHSP